MFSIINIYVTTLRTIVFDQLGPVTCIECAVDSAFPPQMLEKFAFEHFLFNQSYLYSFYYR